MAEIEQQIASVLGSSIERFEGTDVVLLGDSITQGLGSRRVSFSQSLQGNLGEGFRVLNLAYTGTTIDFPLALVGDVRFPSWGGVAVILYGNVDAQIRPSRTGRVFPMLPVRFQKNGMLMPRPFYSRNKAKSIVQHGENLLRKVFSRVIEAVDGTEQWVSLSSFEAQYRELVRQLGERGFVSVCCSTVYIDEALFKGSLDQYVAFNMAIERIACEFGTPYVDLFSLLRAAVSESGRDGSYSKDHFHPNGNGYLLIADRIAEAVKEVLERWEN